jgi:hypothetical protein
MNIVETAFQEIKEIEILAPPRTLDGRIQHYGILQDLTASKLSLKKYYKNRRNPKKPSRIS